MRVFAVSDIHVDYAQNLTWVQGLSRSDYRDDVLILAGDVSHRPALLGTALEALAQCFHRVLFVPGNHDLWVLGEPAGTTSLQKFAQVLRTAEQHGAATAPTCIGGVQFVPLLGWYDDSFGEPEETLREMWMDYRACQWPTGWDAADVARHFESLNPTTVRPPGVGRVISFSHFLPRIDLIPPYVPRWHRTLDPVLGSTRIEDQLRALQPDIHVYGHSHINRAVSLDGVRYINNALGYPQEGAIASRRLVCVAEV